MNHPFWILFLRNDLLVYNRIFTFHSCIWTKRWNNIMHDIYFIVFELTFKLYKLNVINKWSPCDDYQQYILSLSQLFQNNMIVLNIISFILVYTCTNENVYPFRYVSFTLRPPSEYIYIYIYSWVSGEPRRWQSFTIPEKSLTSWPVRIHSYKHMLLRIIRRL